MKEAKRTDNENSSYDESIGQLSNADGYAVSGESEFSRERSDPYEMVDFLIDRDVNHRGHGPAGFTLTDERIYEIVCEGLTQSSEIDASDIVVKVHQGKVTLSGTVPDMQTYHLAQLLSQDLPGVDQLENQLEIYRH
jgi:hypothetical protein